MTELELAYVAGFFDGEGCISVTGERIKHYRLSRIAVHIANTDFRPLQMLKKTCGGHYRQVQRPGRKEYAVWSLSCKKAAEFLSLILPYLIIKKERAILALEIFKANSRERRTKNRNEKGQFLPASIETRMVIARNIEAIKELNA